MITIILLHRPSELDKCANNSKHHVDLFSRTILIVRVDPKRSLVLWPGRPVSKQSRIPHCVTGLGGRVMCPRGRQRHERAIETPRNGLSSKVVQAQKKAGEAILNLSHSAPRIWANPSDHVSVKSIFRSGVANRGTA